MDFLPSHQITPVTFLYGIGRGLSISEYCHFEIFNPGCLEIIEACNKGISLRRKGYLFY